MKTVQGPKYHILSFMNTGSHNCVWRKVLKYKILINWNTIMHNRLTSLIYTFSAVCGNVRTPQMCLTSFSSQSVSRVLWDMCNGDNWTISVTINVRGETAQLTLNKTHNVTVQVVLEILQYRRINTQMRYNPTIQANTVIRKNVPLSKTMSLTIRRPY